MPPLPKVDSALESRLSLDPHLISAYRICLKHEEELTSEDQVRRVRILGFLLLYTTKDNVRVYLTKSIFSCKDDLEMLVHLGRFIEQNVILPCEFSFGYSFPVYLSMLSCLVQSGSIGVEPRRPAPIYQGLLSRNTGKIWKPRLLKRPKITRMPKTSSVDAPLHSQSVIIVLGQALIRDNWRCLITGYVDYNAPAEARPLVRDNSWVPGSHTECAHIIPEATFFKVKEKSNKVCGYQSP